MIGRNDPPSRDPRGRTEPTLGNLDQLDVPPRRASADGLPPLKIDRPHREPPPMAPKPRHAAWPWALAALIAVVVIGGAWVWTHQNALRADLPRTQLNAILARGDSALAAGKLSGSPESARDQYEAALALDPDSEHALTGLRKVGSAELKRAQDDIAQGKLEDARAALEEARGLLGNAAIASTEATLNKAANRGATIEVLLDQARTALAANNIEGKDGAADLFHRVLVSDPDNPVARHGMDQVGSAIATQVQDQLNSHDRAGAQRTLDRLAALVPNYAQLPSLRAAIAQANQDAQAQRDQHLAQGEADLRAGKITGSDDDNALAQFQAALALDPNNAQAQAGLGQVAQALVVQANAALDAGHADDAKQLLDAAAKLAPKSADLAAARSRLQAKAQAQAQTATAANDDQAGAPAQPALTPAQSAKVANMVKQADVAAHQGELMLPPGDSAYDLYRGALAMDPDNAAAQAGLHALPHIAQQLFGRALHGGKLEHAGDLLSTLAELSPGDPALGGMQHNLGGAWIARARTLAEKGRYDDARRALEQARRLTPDDPRIPEVDNRIGYGN
ncbi:MAG TPA: tetratricopeptide repeat protein [Rhodanobacteraceae bacterium]|nr:tetratricopeptide repeat protein [Rhodanobacteraceae bacterium]